MKEFHTPVIVCARECVCACLCLCRMAQVRVQIVHCISHPRPHTIRPFPETFLQSIATPPMKRPKSSQSDLAMSASSDGSPIRRPRPHSVAGRLPSYASPTVSSQIRMSRDSEKKSSGNLTVCYRFSKFMLCHLYFSSPHFIFITTTTLPPFILCVHFSLSLDLGRESE